MGSSLSTVISSGRNLYVSGMRISAEGSDECKIAGKAMLTEKECSEPFNITVPIQLFPLVSVTVRWAVLVGDTDEKGPSLWSRAAFSVLALAGTRTSLEIARLARTAFDTIRLAKTPHDIALLAKNARGIVLLMKTLFDIVLFAETVIVSRTYGPSGVRVAGGPGTEALREA